MLIRSQPTTLLQIFCESLLYFWVIFKSIIGPDDNSHLPHSGASCEEDGVLDLQEFLEEVAVPRRVHRRHQHLEERNFTIVAERQDYFLPQIHTLGLVIHVAAPQVPAIGQLQDQTKLCNKNCTQL